MIAPGKQRECNAIWNFQESWNGIGLKKPLEVAQFKIWWRLKSFAGTPQKDVDQPLSPHWLQLHPWWCTDFNGWASTKLGSREKYESFLLQYFLSRFPCPHEELYASAGGEMIRIIGETWDHDDFGKLLRRMRSIIYAGITPLLLMGSAPHRLHQRPRAPKVDNSCYE